MRNSWTSHGKFNVAPFVVADVFPSFQPIPEISFGIMYKLGIKRYLKNNLQRHCEKWKFVEKIQMTLSKLLDDTIYVWRKTLSLVDYDDADEFCKLNNFFLIQNKIKTAYFSFSKKRHNRTELNVKYMGHSGSVQSQRMFETNVMRFFSEFLKNTQICVRYAMASSSLNLICITKW